MSVEVTLPLPDGLFERAQRWANQAERPVADFLVETLEASLLPLGQVPRPVTEWTNEEVLSAADYRMSPAEDQRLRELLARHREGCLTQPEATQLQRLMLGYQEGLLRKALGVREAVRRGLRKPPEP